MPTYSYLCEACKTEFEREQRISDPPIKKCPSCGKQKARRMINSANFILKGGGWYSDGYGSSKPASGGSSGKGSSKGDKAEASSSDSTSSTPASTSSDTAATSSPSTKPAPSTAKSTD